jgi:hypothetical protein
MLWSFSLVLTGASGAAAAAGAGNPAAGGSLLSSAEPDSVLPVSLRPLRRSAIHRGTSPLLISIQMTAEAGKGPDADSLVRIEARFLETASPVGGIGQASAPVEAGTPGRAAMTLKLSPSCRNWQPGHGKICVAGVRTPGIYRSQQERNPGFCHSGRSKPSTPEGCLRYSHTTAERAAVPNENRGEKVCKQDTVPSGFHGRLRGAAVDIYRSGEGVL